MFNYSATFVDYNGNTRNERFMFNLSKAEAMEMELGVKGGLAEMIQRIIDAQDGPTIVKTFKELILKAYGEKSPDGREFVKSEELSTKFSQTEAYSQLFMKLATDAKFASEFVNGIMDFKPEELKAATDAATNNANTAPTPALAAVPPATPTV